MSQIAIDRRKVPMRSFLSGFKGIMKIWGPNFKTGVTFTLSRLLNLCYII